jgi:hypothetical protein
MRSMAENACFGRLWWRANRMATIKLVARQLFQLPLGVKATAEALYLR